MTIRQRIIDYYRDNIGCSQKEAARDLGLSRVTIWKYLTEIRAERAVSRSQCIDAKLIFRRTQCLRPQTPSS